MIELAVKDINPNITVTDQGQTPQGGVGPPDVPSWRLVEVAGYDKTTGHYCPPPLSRVNT